MKEHEAVAHVSSPVVVGHDVPVRTAIHLHVYEVVVEDVVLYQHILRTFAERNGIVIVVYSTRKRVELVPMQGEPSDLLEPEVSISTLMKVCARYPAIDGVLSQANRILRDLYAHVLDGHILDADLLDRMHLLGDRIHGGIEVVS